MKIPHLSHPTLSALSLAAALALSASARADVKLPTLFSDHMVLQQENADPVWGTASPNEEVSVKVGDKSASTTAGPDGKWMVKVGPLKAGPAEMTVAGKNTITIKDVLVGEVWVCSGQSNMGMTVNGVKDKAKEIAEANHPQIRMFHVPNTALDEPATDVPKGAWTVCSPETVASYSAAAYFFGRDLQEAIKQPVGLINTSWGGTRIEPWISPASLENDPISKEAYEKFKDEKPASPEDIAAFEKKNAEWQKEANEAKKDKKPTPPGRPTPPAGKMQNIPAYGRLYNAMVNPLIPFAIKGAVWYQGESNGGEGVKYRTWLPELVTDWRTHWNQPGATHDFPFLIVQLPNNNAKSGPGAESTGWTLVREAEMQTASKLPNVGTAVTIDTSSDGNLHPPEKQPVGHRLALIAENRFYGMKDVADSGPVYDSAKPDGDKLVITFKETHGGLVAKGEKLTGFYVAGEDKKWAPADATIEGDTVVLHSAEVAKPVAARYAWAQNPTCDLFNKADLPAGPFRTDDWESAAPTAPVRKTAKAADKK